MTYHCISVDDALGTTSELCDAASEHLVSLDEVTGQLTMQSIDMITYPPGDYSIVIKGLSGTQTPIEVDLVMPLTLVNPCPTASLKNLQAGPFNSVQYTLGDE